MHRPRVALYARYSTDMQNPKSVDDQFRECRKHAERQGWQVAETFADRGISGATSERPEYQRLLSSVRDQKFDIVLIEHVDRLGRDSELVWAFYKTITHADAEIHQLGRGKLGMLDIGILSTFSALFLEELGKKTRRGLEGKVENGLSAGGLSYGYRVASLSNGLSDTGKLKIVEEQATIIRRIFQEYAEGKSPPKDCRRIEP